MNKIPLVLSPSQQKGNKCVLGDTESDHMRRIMDYVSAEMIKDTRFDVYLIPELDGIDDNDRLVKLVERSNAFIGDRGSALHISAHSDAGYQGHGSSAFWYRNGSMGEKTAKAIYKRICRLTPWTDMRAYARPELYELKNTKASSALIEISFHDQQTEALWIHKNVEEIGICFIGGIYEAVAIEKPDTESTQLLNKMYSNNLINDIEYWKKILNGEESADKDILQLIFKRSVKDIV